MNNIKMQSTRISARFVPPAETSANAEKRVLTPVKNQWRDGVIDLFYFHQKKKQQQKFTRSVQKRRGRSKAYLTFLLVGLIRLIRFYAESNPSTKVKEIWSSITVRGFDLYIYIYNITG